MSPVNCSHFLDPTGFICILTAGLPNWSKSALASVMALPNNGATPSAVPFKTYNSVTSSALEVVFPQANFAFEAVAGNKALISDLFKYELIVAVSLTLYPINPDGLGIAFSNKGPKSFASFLAVSFLSPNNSFTLDFASTDLLVFTTATAAAGFFSVAFKASLAAVKKLPNSSGFKVSQNSNCAV